MFWLAVYGVSFLSGANYSHWYHIKGSMELIILVAIEPCVDLPFAMFTIYFGVGLFLAFGSGFQPGMVHS